MHLLFWNQSSFQIHVIYAQVLCSESLNSQQNYIGFNKISSLSEEKQEFLRRTHIMSSLMK